MPIIHKIDSLYKELYIVRRQISKPDRFGLYAKIENIVIDCLTLAIETALSARNEKMKSLQELRIKIEVGKRMTRLLWELNVITDKKHILFQQSLQEISKMANGWIKYLNKGP